jgi:hypothetical protein
MFYGDTAGWLYSFNDTNGVYEHQREEEARHGFSGSWMPEINLTSEVCSGHIFNPYVSFIKCAQISSICVSDLRCVATSFGPVAKIMVQDLSTAKLVAFTSTP